MSRIPIVAGSDNPPNWCFRTNDEGDLPTCTYVNGEWHRSYDDAGFGAQQDPGIPGFFVLLFVLALLGGIAVTVWKVSTARRMARDSGMSETDATTMTLLTDDGFEATYLAANLRPPQQPAVPTTPTPPTTPQPGTRSTAERLRELQALLEQGLISQDEYAARRQALIDGV
jgi:hypothetical protein